MFFSSSHQPLITPHTQTPRQQNKEDGSRKEGISRGIITRIIDGVRKVYRHQSSQKPKQKNYAKTWLHRINNLSLFMMNEKNPKR
jgi:hypothetical protein